MRVTQLNEATILSSIINLMHREGRASVIGIGLRTSSELERKSV